MGEAYKKLLPFWQLSLYRAVCNSADNLLLADYIENKNRNLNKKLKSFNKKNKQLKIDLKKVKKFNQSLISSNSWRLTKNLRR